MVEPRTFGRLALEKGLISSDQLKEASDEQARDVASGHSPARTLEDILVSRGYLTEEQRHALLAEAKTQILSHDLHPLGQHPRAAPKELEAFGKYHLLRELGRGGMGVVFEALDTVLNRRVALKMIRGDATSDPESEREADDRFLREARLAAALEKHPHIVGIYEADIVSGRRYIAMEYVDGRPMDEWWQSVDLAQRVALLRDVALAVHVAHESGVIHRDLKPANVLIDTKGRPRITDFGLAKAFAAESKVSLTGQGMVVGTPSYMSPEQAQARKAVDPRSDVYSLGVMLYEMMTGRLPFVGDTPLTILLQVIRDPVPPPSSLHNEASVDAGLEKVCLRALAKNVDERTPTARQFAEELSQWLADRPKRAVSAPGGRGRSVKRGLTLAGVALAVLLAAGFAFWHGDPHSQGPKAPGERIVNLLKLVDPLLDSVSGRWVVSNGTLVSDNSSGARIEFPYVPPAEYDYRVTFSVEKENGCDLHLILSQSGRPFKWIMGARGNQLFGFEQIGGMWASDHPSSTRMPNYFVAGRTYTAVVEVRRTGLRALLDDKPICEWKTTYEDMSMPSDDGLRDPRLLGLRTWQSSLTFPKVELVEVTGHGAATR